VQTNIQRIVSMISCAVELRLLTYSTVTLYVVQPVIITDAGV